MAAKNHQLHLAFCQKEISIRLLHPVEGKSLLHGICERLLASGIIVTPEASAKDCQLFIPNESIDLWWVR